MPEPGAACQHRYPTAESAGQQPTEVDMGLLDSVVGALGGALGGGAGGQGGGNAALLNLVVGMLANQGGVQGGAQGGAGGLAGALGGLGGLGGLIGKFQQGGLGDVVGSWVGTGQNLPVSPDQLHNVLGSDIVSQIAAQLGVSPGDAAGQLSQLLPEVVDKLTPQGEVPSGELGGIADILGRFASR